MPDKSKAQLEQEAEVKRILESRGYSSKENRKNVNKTLGRNFSFKPFFIGIVLIALVVGGVIFFKNNPFDKKDERQSATIIRNTGSKQEATDFYACLNSVDVSEITIGDPDFWGKYITRYEQTLSCYNQYPSVASSSEKSQLEADIERFRENSKQAGANDAEYRANVAKIEAERAQNLARIKAEADAWDEELARRVQERNAAAEQQRAAYEQQRSAYEQQQSAYEQQQAAAAAEKQRQCDSYMAQYGDKTADELAEADSEVRSAKHTYDEKAKAYNKAYNDLYKSGAVLTADRRTYYQEKYDTAQSEMNSAYYTYQSLLNSKKSYYSNLKTRSCGS